MAKGRGSDKAPGEFRRTQNWIGGTRPGNARYVPPPPHEVMPALDAFEKFLHNRPTHTATLLKAALAHVQFETIHPFLDGNGRVGRLLITFVLCAEGVLSEPLLYLSLYFKKHRDEYYRLLQEVRTDGDWEGWVRFLLSRRAGNLKPGRRHRQIAASTFPGGPNRRREPGARQWFGIKALPPSAKEAGSRSARGGKINPGLHSDNSRDH